MPTTPNPWVKWLGSRAASRTPGPRFAPARIDTVWTSRSSTSAEWRTRGGGTQGGAPFTPTRSRGHEHRAEPFKLASGQLSHDYIDGKYAVDTGERLALVSRAVADLAANHGIDFDAVGGLARGAEQ